MKSKKSIVIIFISIIIFFVFRLDVYASSSFLGLETKINYESNETKIKKLQLALNAFGLYGNNIDGNYNSVKNSLILYQKSTGINKNLGYFGVKTLTALKEDYPNIFDKISRKYLKMDKPSNNIRYFYITAYYSPLANQKRYSYNVYKKRYRTFLEEKRLQGEGKITASGKKVFEGILAGPRNYSYGTKIEFEGLGVGVIEDRGGAIVNKGERGHEFDRIDVWMGYGDEGLERALKWGKRKVKGKVVPSIRPVTIQFNRSNINNYKNLKVDAQNPKSENIIKLEKLFTEIGLYKGNIDGNYNSIKKILIKYQVSRKIILSNKSKHAGYFGNKSFAAIRKEFGGGIFRSRNNKLDKDVILSDEIREKLDKIHIKISNIIDNKFGKNTLRSIVYRERLRKLIDNQTHKIKNNLRKRQLEYLKSII